MTQMDSLCFCFLSEAFKVNEVMLIFFSRAGIKRSDLRRDAALVLRALEQTN